MVIQKREPTPLRVVGKIHFREKRVLLSTETLPNNSPSFPRDHMFYFVIRTNNMQRKHTSRLNAKEMLRFISSLAERLDLLRSFSTHSEDCGGSGHSLFA